MICTAFHGLTAFRGGRDAVAKARAVRDLADNAELCVADTALGRVGLLVSGVMTAVHACDVWSELGEDGRRVSEYGEPDMCFPTQQEFSAFARQIQAENARSFFAGHEEPSDREWHRARVTRDIARLRRKGREAAARGLERELERFERAISGDTRAVQGLTPYCEGWMSHPVVHAVWYTDGGQEQAERVAAELDVPARYLSEEDRIWDVVSDYDREPEPLPYEEYDVN